MSIHLEPDAAENCVGICDRFADTLDHAATEDTFTTSTPMHGSFDTARQLSAVYSLFAGEDLESMLSGFVDQARAMSMVFAAAGGLIEAQDEALATALGRASAEPAALQSLGVMGSLSMVAAPDMELPEAELAPLRDGYDRVGPEDVSGASLEQMASGARALDEAQFRQVATRVGSVADTLEEASGQLQSGLGAILGQGWQGEFAARAGTSVAALTRSATELAGALREVAGKAAGAADGFTVTRQNVGSQASEYALVQQTTPGAGPVAGPASPAQHEQMAAARAAAEEQARAVINTEYSPAVMDANLSGLDFPTAYRVVASSGLGGPGGVDLNSIWNQDGVIRPAGAGTPPPATLTTLTGDGTGGAGAAAPAAGAGAAGAAAGLPASAAGAGAAVPVDAGTEQALHTSRQGAGATAAAGAGPAGAGAAGASPAGVNAATTAAAGTPLLAPGSGTPQNSGAAAAAGARTGGRYTSSGSDRGDRGFGTAAGLVGGGGAAAAGASAASRMGGAGTLSGLGGPTAPGAPPAPGTAPAAAGPASSSTGAHGGRMGAMPMGMMGAAGAAGRNDTSQGHRPASYLVNATNTSEIVGEPVKVTPPRIGALPDATPPAEPTPAPVSPAQALLNKLTNR